MNRELTLPQQLAVVVLLLLSVAGAAWAFFTYLPPDPPNPRRLLIERTRVVKISVEPRLKETTVPALTGPPPTPRPRRAASGAADPGQPLPEDFHIQDDPLAFLKSEGIPTGGEPASYTPISATVLYSLQNATWHTGPDAAHPELSAGLSWQVVVQRDGRTAQLASGRHPFDHIPGHKAAHGWEADTTYLEQRARHYGLYGIIESWRAYNSK